MLQKPRLLVALLLACSVALLAGCSRPASQDGKHNEPKPETSAQVQAAQPEAEQEYTEPENGVYEEESGQPANSASSGAQDYDIQYMVKQLITNPVAVEASMFRTQGRIVSIKTENDQNGERVAVVALEHPLYKKSGDFKYGLGAIFNCVMTLEEAAQYKPDDVIGVMGQISDIQDEVSYYNDVKVVLKHIYAVCSPEAIS